MRRRPSYPPSLKASALWRKTNWFCWSLTFAGYCLSSLNLAMDMRLWWVPFGLRLLTSLELGFRRNKLLVGLKSWKVLSIVRLGLKSR